MIKLFKYLFSDNRLLLLSLLLILILLMSKEQPFCYTFQISAKVHPQCGLFWDKISDTL